MANALTRKASRLDHFEVDAINDPAVLRLAEKIEVIPDPALDARGHTAVDMRIWTKDSREYVRGTDIAPGFPESPLTTEEHLRRFRDCIGFATQPVAEEKVAGIIDWVAGLEEARDIHGLAPLLLQE